MRTALVGLTAAAVLATWSGPGLEPASAHTGHYCGHSTHSIDWNTRERFVSSHGSTSAWHWHYTERQELSILGWRYYSSYPKRLCRPH